MKMRFELFAVLMLAGLTACATYERTGPSEPVAAALPAAEGEAVRAYLNRQNDYRQWPLWPGKGRLYPGRHPHGALLTAYVSDGVLRALETSAGRVPAGGMIVKENFRPDRSLEAVTVMYRRPGYNPEAGNWFWLKFEPGGAILAEGKVNACIECHRQAEANDWLFTGPIR